MELVANGIRDLCQRVGAGENQADYLGSDA
jgi:hypothetical protein